jgi:Double zinc ribbon
VGSAGAGKYGKGIWAIESEDNMSNQKLTFSSELRVVPSWAYVLSFIVLACFEGFMAAMWRHEPNPPPMVIVYFISVVPGLILAFLPLLIGYVNQDARRRGMNRTLWTLLVIFIPNAIGFILYFLLRKPISVQCPGCGAVNNPTFIFCPKCKFNLRLSCPDCQHAVSPGDRFCAFCSRELMAEHTPAGS